MRHNQNPRWDDPCFLVAAENKLSFFYEYKGGKSKKFPATEYQGFLQYIRNNNIQTLDLCQMSFQDRANAAAMNFEQFFTQLLLHTPALTHLILGGDSSVAINFSRSQFRILTRLLGENTSLRRLTLHFCGDTQEHATRVAEMLRANTHLEFFSSNNTDDHFRFPVLMAGLQHPTLNRLELPCTSRPLGGLPRPAAARNIPVLFEGGREMTADEIFAADDEEIPAIIPNIWMERIRNPQAQAPQGRGRRRDHEGEIINANPEEHRQQGPGL